MKSNFKTNLLSPQSLFWLATARDHLSVCPLNNVFAFHNDGTKYKGYHTNKYHYDINNDDDDNNSGASDDDDADDDTNDDAAVKLI